MQLRTDAADKNVTEIGHQSQGNGGSDFDLSIRLWERCQNNFAFLDVQGRAPL